MKKTHCKLNKAALFVDLSGITLKISLSLLEPKSPRQLHGNDREAGAEFFQTFQSSDGC